MSLLQLILQRSNALAEQQLEECMRNARNQELTLTCYLVSHDILEQYELSRLCAKYLQLEYINLKGMTEQIAWDFLSLKLCKRLSILPIKFKKIITLAVGDVDKMEGIIQIIFQKPSIAKLLICDYQQITLLLNQNYLKSNEQPNSQTKLNAEDFVNHFLNDAINHNASDIHLDAKRNHYVCRWRCDGILKEVIKLDHLFAQGLINHIKIKAELDIAETRLPQDGRFFFRAANLMSYNCRVNSCPLVHGEKLVIRILASKETDLSLAELGMPANQMGIFKNTLRKPQGLILVTGPTGSGKTRTLYAALNILNDISRNIVTVEDPVELELPGLNQVNVNQKIGRDFTQILRAFLRQDPDVIMVGEIRDRDTAEIAIKAAQTGHLVLSTLHCNDSFAALTRLQNMGIPNYNLGEVFNLIIAQRLLRRICTACQQQLPLMRNCPECQDGFSGRIGLFEFFQPSQEVNHLILQGAPISQIKTQAKLDGWQSLHAQGMALVTKKLTTMAELERVVQTI